MEAGTVSALLPAAILATGGVAAFSVHVGMTQWDGMAFAAPRRRCAWLAFICLFAAAMANCLWRDPSATGVAVGALLVALGLVGLVQRNGVGRAGVFLDGAVLPWEKLSDVELVASDDGTVLRFTVGRSGRWLRLTGASMEEVAALLPELAEPCRLPVR